MPNDNLNYGLHDLVQEKTEGRRYAFVIMHYGADYSLYEQIVKVVNSEFNIACIRADDLKSAGHDLLAKIHHLISRAELVIAEISHDSPNVFYEVGYAVASGKPPLIVAKRGREVPVDLRGLEVIRYTESRDGISDFLHDLSAHIRTGLNQDMALLRDMLEAPVRHRAFIVASPKYAGKEYRARLRIFDTKTYGDHLGILGLIAAFGSAWGDSKGIELVSAQHTAPNLTEASSSFYLIGSSKVNQHTKMMLSQLQEGLDLQWTFERLDDDPVHLTCTGDLSPTNYRRRAEDYYYGLYKIENGERRLYEPSVSPANIETDSGPQVRYIEDSDYGLIMRSPHPRYADDRLVVILAGAHSIGTGAACVVATNPRYLKLIRDRLPEGVFADKSRAFWVLVKGVADSDHMLDTENIEIVDCAELPKR